MQSYNFDNATRTQADKEQIIKKYVEIFQLMDLVRTLLESAHIEYGIIDTITRETPDYDFSIITIEIENLTRKLNATDAALHAKPEMDALAFLNVGEELANARHQFNSVINEFILKWQSVRRPELRRSFLVAEDMVGNWPKWQKNLEDSLDPELVTEQLKKLYPEAYAKYEADMLEKGLEDIRRVGLGCPPLNFKVLDDSFYVNAGKPECYAPPKQAIGAGPQAQAFDPVFLLKLTGGGLLIGYCLLKVYQNANRVSNAASFLISGMKSGFTKFTTNPYRRVARDDDEKLSQQRPQAQARR
jgi:hypothetical protein